MSGYTVTITPADDKSGPETTIHVDTTTGSARVIELSVRAADGDGLSPQQLPVIDLVGLIAALAPGKAAPAITAVEAPTGRTRRGEPATVEATATSARSSRSTKGRAAKASPKKSTATRPRRRQAAEAATAAPERTGRAYRRMPDEKEVLAAWRQSHSATAMAEHFGVPRHTATGWLRRLRRMGLVESAS
jgi:hypothetical protein